MKPIFLFLFIFSYPLFNYAQVGGDNTFQFLQLPVSSRIQALGGNLITVNDGDVTLANNNPASLSARAHQQIAFNYQTLFAGIRNGYVGYAHQLNKWNITTHLGIQFVNYGSLKGADEYGNETAPFAANEYAITLGAAKQLSERISIGSNIRYIGSQFETYRASGIGADAVAMYSDTASQFTATLALQNVGYQLTAYKQREKLPFEVQIGISKKLRYLPLRFSVIYHHAQRWNLRYDNPTEQNDILFLGEETTKTSNTSLFFDNLFRHFIFSGEFLIGKNENLRLRVGYNHQRRKELSVINFRSLSGFSGGIGVKIYRFRIDYSFASYHLVGSTHQFGISTGIQEFRR